MDFQTLVTEIIATGKTQTWIAEKVDCSQSTVSDLANGNTKTPSFDLGRRLVDLHKNAVSKRARH
jgi:predicted transcriptional regulator